MAKILAHKICVENKCASLNYRSNQICVLRKRKKFEIPNRYSKRLSDIWWLFSFVFFFVFVLSFALQRSIFQIKVKILSRVYGDGVGCFSVLLMTAFILLTFLIMYVHVRRILELMNDMRCKFEYYSVPLLVNY